MTARSWRLLVIATVVAASSWFVARPAFGGVARDAAPPGASTWRTPVADAPWDVAGGRSGFVVTTGSGVVWSLGASGRVQWRSAVADLVLGQPAVGTGVVAVGGVHAVTVLDRGDGHVRWRQSRAGDVHSVTVAGDAVVVGDDSGTLAAFDVATGGLRWTVQHPGALWSGARVDRATGAVVATWHQGDEPAVRVIDLATGALRWQAATDRSTAAPTLGRGLVLLAIGDGERHARIVARDLASGAVRWSTAVPASFEEAIEPSADGRALAVVDHFGVVSVLDLATGRMRWQHDLADVVLEARVILTAHRVALTSRSGTLWVLDRRGGRLVGHVPALRLGGLPVATLAVPWAGIDRVLLALRLPEPAIALRRLP